MSVKKRFKELLNNNLGSETEKSKNPIYKFARKYAAKIITVVLIVCSGLILINSIGLNSFQRNIETFPLDVEWTLEINNEVVSENISLPYLFGRNVTGEYTFTTIIPQTSMQVQMITFNVYFKDVWVYIDDELIYDHTSENNILNKNNSGSGQVRTILPSGTVGKTLKIKYNCHPCTEETYFNTPKILDASKHVFSLSTSDIAMLFTMLAFLFVAIFATIIYLADLTSLEDSSPYLYLSLFFMCTALWVLCYTRLIEICVDDWGFSLNLEYISFYAIAMSVWLLYEKIWNKKSMIVRVMRIFSIAFFAVVVMSNLFFDIPFTTFLTPFHFLAAATILIISFQLIKNRKGETLSYRIFGYGIACLLLSGVIGLCEYYIAPSSNHFGLMFIGAIAVAGILFVVSVFVFSSDGLKKHFHKAISGNKQTEYMRYEALLCNDNQTFFDWDTDKDTAYIPDNFREFFRFNFDEKSFTNNIFMIVPSLKTEHTLLNAVNELKSGKETERIETSYIDNKNEEKFIIIDLTSNYDLEGNKTHIIGVIKDTTETIKLEQENFRQMQFIGINNQLYDNVLEADIENDLLMGEKTDEFAKFLDMGDNRKFSDAIKLISEKLTHPDYRHEYLEIFSRERILSLYKDGIDNFQAQTYELSQKGTYEWLQLNVIIYRSMTTNAVSIVSYIKNITQIKEKELELLESSTIDFLSQLLNKGSSVRTIDQVLSESDPIKDRHALLLIDIDEFKGVNDTFGHATGDKVISDVSNKLKTLFREEDIIGRFGGDEFVVLLKHVRDVKSLEEKCKEVNREVRFKYEDGDKSKQISLSIGLACYPLHGVDYETLCANADKAMYVSKRNGRNTYTIYSEDMEDNS